MAARFAIGIDLGTTNSVLAYAALADEAARGKPAARAETVPGDDGLAVLPIPQVVAPGTIEARPSLPSFLYLPADAERAGGVFDLPWGAAGVGVVGEYARQQGATAPDRTVAAAKSWLTLAGVDRRADILPFQADEEVPKVSPVTASRLYLEHLVAAWDHAHPDAPLAKQVVVLTVPASFDAAARELTREAALAAGLPASLILLEEPQAALYSWLAHHGDAWRKQVAVGERILVCDCGGGTTDLTLVEVVDEGGDLQLSRVAVGDHLLVGGDNMDLLLAHHAAEGLAARGTKLNPWQAVGLWHAARRAKESLLGADPPEVEPVSILGRGSRLIKNTVTAEIARTDAERLLVDGFFPVCELTDEPERRRASGFLELGLPYETDTAVTRHLASFLTRQAAGDGRPVIPRHVLFGGGVFKSAALRQRLAGVLESWAAAAEFADDAVSVAALAGGVDFDQAVARGAAYYGRTSRTGGIRIRGGTARSYYIGVETSGLALPGMPRPLAAICVVPFGLEEGSRLDVPGRPIGLVVGQPARFRFFSSTVRQEDRPGQRLPVIDEEELTETDSLETTLPAEADADETLVPVTFESHVTELGLLELWCVHVESGRRWKLEYRVREDA